MVLPVGATAPDFLLSDQHGEELSLHELLEAGPVCLVFVPFAFSRICTGEFAELSTHEERFATRGVRLIGVSVDSVWALRAWADDEGFSFSILSDFWPHGSVARAYDAFVDETGAAARASLLIGVDRRVAWTAETPRGEGRPLAGYLAALDGLHAV